jgi:hypothetical protein
MYWDHESFEKPEDENIKIWRYLDFTKFVYLLENNALFFTRADKFGDKFEGSYPKLTIKSRKERFDPKSSDYLSRFAKKLTEVVLINSWHINNNESEAMWKLHLKSNEGVAVQSTFKQLNDSFACDTENQVYIGKVKYIDYNSDSFQEGNFFQPYLCKRKSFEYEQELRAITLYQPININSPKFLIEDFKFKGIDLPIDIKILIEHVYVSPYAPTWFFNIIKSVIKRYHLDLEPLQSSLVDTPLF